MDVIESVRTRMIADIELIILVAGFIGWRVVTLEGGLFNDEALYAVIADQMVRRGELYGSVPGHGTHLFAPLAKYAMGLGQLVVGPTPTGIRLPILLFGAGTLFVTGLLGRELGDRLLGALAATVLAVTQSFAIFAGVGMLDVPLACLFTATVLATVRWLCTPSPRMEYLIGGLLVGLVATKALGVVFALPIAAVVGTRVLVDRREIQRIGRISGGVAVAGFLVYLPFLVVSHPPLPEGIPGPIAAVVSIPILGNLAYAFGSGAFLALDAAVSQHNLLVGSTLYEHPPLWGYVQWLLTKGGWVAVAGGFGTVVGGVLDWRRDRSWTALLLVSVVVVPFAVLTVIPTKYPRYLLPLFPILIVAGCVYGRAVVRWTVDRVLTDPWDGPTRTASLFVLGIVLLAVLPPSPALATVEDGVRVDTGFDDAAAVINTDAAERESTPIVVASHHADAARYHFDPASPWTGSDRFDVMWLPVEPREFTEMRDRLAACAIDYVVDIAPRSRLGRTTVATWIETNSTVLARIPQSPPSGIANMGETLVVSRMTCPDAG